MAWSNRLECDHCQRIVLCRVPTPKTGDRIWCPDCAPDCLVAAGYERTAFLADMLENGCVFIQEGLANMVADPTVVADLWAVENRRIYTIPYNRLERLIERGLVNATGAKLTSRGLAWITI